MTTQEVTLRAYYAHMTDAELLETAANRKSFIEVAQRLVAEELHNRNLVEPPESGGTQTAPKRWRWFRR